MQLSLFHFIFRALNLCIVICTQVGVGAAGVSHKPAPLRLDAMGRELDAFGNVIARPVQVGGWVCWCVCLRLCVRVCICTCVCASLLLRWHRSVWCHCVWRRVTVCGVVSLCVVSLCVASQRVVSLCVASQRVNQLASGGTASVMPKDDSPSLHAHTFFCTQKHTNLHAACGVAACEPAGVWGHSLSHAQRRRNIQDASPTLRRSKA